jgi:hypothetical protein
MINRKLFGSALPVGIALLLAAAPAAGRQTVPDRAERQGAWRAQRMEKQEARHEAAVSRLAERLELTDAQKASVGEIMQIDEETGRGGDAWMLAAVLNRELSDEQLGKLFETSRTAAIYRRGVADGFRRGGGRSVRTGNRAAPMRGAMANLRLARIETMQMALQLSEEQVRILRIHDALAAIMGARRGAQSAGLQGARRFGAGARTQGARRLRSGTRFGR